MAAYLPILNWLPTYNRAWLRPDLVAGVTLAAFTIPESMAYADLAGLPPQYGLYASLAAPILYLFFGTSRQLVIGPTSAVSILVASGVGLVAAGAPEQYAALAAILAIEVAVIAFIARIARLGFLVNFISEAVLIGFSTGAALYIASTQLPKLFGIHGAEGAFFERIAYLLQHLGETNPWALAIGLLGLVILVLGEHVYPRLPWSLIVVLGSILVMNPALTDLASRGVAIAGELPAGLPNIGVPDFTLADIRVLLPTALAVFLLAYVEGMSMARTFAAKNKYRVDADQELLALGAANLSVGLTQGFPVAGSMSRTALNDSSGAQSQLASGVSALLIVVVLLFLTGLFTYLPEPILATVVLVAVRGLLKVKEMRSLYQVHRIEFWIAMIALFGVLLFGMLEGVLLGAILSLLVVVGHASRGQISVLGRIPGHFQLGDVRRNPENLTIPGMPIVRVDEPIFYANARSIGDQVLAEALHSEPRAKTVVLDLEISPDLDLPAVEMLEELHESLTAEEIRLVLTRVQPDARALLDQSGATEILGGQNIYPRNLDAIMDYVSMYEIDVSPGHGMLAELVERMDEVVLERSAKVIGEEHERLAAFSRQLEKAAQTLKELDDADSYSSEVDSE
jgi:high affinity sulfate transporter 1